MKRFIFVLLLVLLTVGQAFARVGEAENFLAQRYGAPVKTTSAAGFDKALFYNSRTYKVEAYMKDGKAVRLVFALKAGGRLSMNRLEHLLHKNGSGTNAMYGRSIWYIDSVAKDGKTINFIDRSSGKRKAFYNLDKLTLTIELN